MVNNNHSTNFNHLLELVKMITKLEANILSYNDCLGNLQGCRVRVNRLGMRDYWLRNLESLRCLGGDDGESGGGFQEGVL